MVRESTDFFAVENEVVAAALAHIAADSHRRPEVKFLVLNHSRARKM